MPLADLNAGLVLIAIVLIALPVGAIAFALGAGGALREIGKGKFAIDQDLPQTPPAPAISGPVREEEIRQMVEARSYRRVARGEEPLDVEAEVRRLTAPPQGSIVGDRGLREEVRQLVVARNERRVRRGEEPLEIEAEIERQLRELENLGQ